MDDLAGVETLEVVLEEGAGVSGVLAILLLLAGGAGTGVSHANIVSAYARLERGSAAFV